MSSLATIIGMQRISNVFRPDESRRCSELIARGHECSRCGRNATRATNGSCLEPTHNGLWGAAPTGGQIVTKMTGRREERFTSCRERAGMTGKHLITDTFTAQWRHTASQLTRWHDSRYYSCTYDRCRRRVSIVVSFGLISSFNFVLQWLHAAYSFLRS